MTRSPLILRAVSACLLFAVLVYASDFVVLRVRLRHPTATSPIEPLTRTRILAIPQKNGKFDYQIDQSQPTEMQNCVHSLFPQLGYLPCWYLKPHFQQPIPVA